MESNVPSNFNCYICGIKHETNNKSTRNVTKYVST